MALADTVGAICAYAPLGRQTLHSVTEGVLLAPREEIRIDRLERGLAQLHGGQVVRVAAIAGSSKDEVASHRRWTFGPR